MDPLKHAEFTGEEAAGSSKVGKEFHAYGDYITAKNLELEPGKKIVQEWTTSEWPEGAAPSILTITLKAVKGGTKLTMVHSLVPAEQSDDYEAGWKEHYWSKLENYFATKKKPKGK
jgi:activator of HSP90 ATPase